MKFKLLIIIISSLLLQSNQSSFWGKEFIFAIPHNEAPGTSIRADFIGIIITASKDTEVKIYTNDKKELFSSFFMNKGESLKIDDNRFKNYEVDEFGDQNGYQYEKCFYLESDEDVTLVLVNSKYTSTDAMSLIPVESWAYNYKHLSYYSFNEDGINRSTGFLIVASEDNTQIEIDFPFNSIDWFSRVNGSRNIEQFKKLNLDSKMVYNISGSSFSNAGIDLSGAEIKANKPIAIISYHQRTKIPYNSGDGRDILLEMPMPLSSWGTKYITSEFKRIGKGDFFRILCSEDDTEINFRSYEKGTQRLIADVSFEMNKNDLVEYNSERFANEGGIKGITVWESNKPIMLMQYAYSSDWDRVENADPFMTSVFPVEQYINEINFTVPDRFKFIDNYVNLIFDLEQDQDLENVTLNGKRLANIYPELLENKIPSTNYHYLTIELDLEDNYQIESDVKFGAYLYGFGDKDSYGYSLAGSFEILDFIDDSAPDIISVESCGIFHVSTFENDTVLDPLSEPINKSSGFQDLRLLESDNFEITDISTSDFSKTISLNVINKLENASAIFRSSDIAGNNLIDTIFYQSEFEDLNTLEMITSEKILNVGDTLRVSFDLSNVGADHSRLLFNYDEKSLFLIGNNNITESEITLSDFDINDGKIQLSLLCLLNINDSTTISLNYLDKDCGIIELLKHSLNIETCAKEFIQVQTRKPLEVNYLPTNKQIQVESDYVDFMEIKISDQTGRLIFNEEVQIIVGSNLVELDLTSFYNRLLLIDFKSKYYQWSDQKLFIEQ